VQFEVSEIEQIRIVAPDVDARVCAIELYTAQRMIAVTFKVSTIQNAKFGAR
jgi:hypothetical protein